MVVLGCRLILGRPSDALARRLVTAGEFHRERPELPIIMSGGKMWDDFRESEVMTRWWSAEGFRTTELVEEAQSLTTRENAKHVAELCARLGYRHVALVTCDFHMKRARRLFLREQLAVTEVPALSKRGRLERIRLAIRELGAEILGEVHSWIR